MYLCYIQIVLLKFYSYIVFYGFFIFLKLILIPLYKKTIYIYAHACNACILAKINIESKKLPKHACFEYYYSY